MEVLFSNLKYTTVLFISLFGLNVNVKEHNEIYTEKEHDKVLFSSLIKEYNINDSLFLNKNTFKIYYLSHKEIQLHKIIIMENNKVILNNDINPLLYSSYALNWIRKNVNGFEISVEYGSRYLYSKVFYFYYYKNHYFLKRIKTEVLDKYDLKYHKKLLKIIKPPILLNNLKLTDYFDVI